MSRWHVTSDDIKLSTGESIREYKLTFETYSLETEKEVEKHLKRIIDCEDYLQALKFEEQFYHLKDNYEVLKKAFDMSLDVFDEQPRNDWKKFLLKKARKELNK